MISFRRKTKEMSADQGALIAALYTTLTRERGAYEALLTRYEEGASAAELRAEALEHARVTAIAQRTFWAGGVADPDGFLAGIPDELNPTRAVMAIARVGYSLTALADDDAIPEMLLSREEVADLFAYYQIEGWLSEIESGVAESVQAALEAQS